MENLRPRGLGKPNPSAASLLNHLRREGLRHQHVAYRQLGRTTSDTTHAVELLTSEGGQGQLDRARKHAADMLRRAGDASLYLDSCEVECRTRGGRGGWRDKTLTKRFSVKEIAMLIGRQG